MKKLLLVPLCLLCFAAKSPAIFEKLFALEGLWQTKTASGVLNEQWHKADSKLLIGKSFMIRGWNTTILENVRLTDNGDKILYTPIVKDENDGKAVSFELISHDNNRYVFENVKHDFPQRIIYHFISNDSLVARIEGISKGKEKSIDYNYSRVKK